MTLHYPSLHPEPDDIVMASRTDGWPTRITRALPIENDATTISMRFQSSERGDARVSGPSHCDTFLVSMDEEPVEVHIDTISEVLGLADSFVHTRSR